MDAPFAGSGAPQTFLRLPAAGPGWVTAQKEVKNSVPVYGCIAAGGRNQGFRATGQRFAGRRFDLEKAANGPADQWVIFFSTKFRACACG
jgi:hypothetical protein